MRPFLVIRLVGKISPSLAVLVVAIVGMTSCDNDYRDLSDVQNQEILVLQDSIASLDRLYKKCLSGGEKSATDSQTTEANPKTEVYSQARTNTDAIEPVEVKSLNSVGWAFNGNSGRWESKQNGIPDATNGIPPMSMRTDDFRDMEMWKFHHAGETYWCWIWIESFLESHEIFGAKKIKTTTGSYESFGIEEKYTHHHYERHVWVIMDRKEHDGLKRLADRKDGQPHILEYRGGFYTVKSESYQQALENAILRSLTLEPTTVPQNEPKFGFEHIDRTAEFPIYFRAQFLFNTLVAEGAEVVRFRLPMPQWGLSSTRASSVPFDKRYHEVKYSKFKSFLM